MTQISEHITYSNNNILSYDQMSKMIVKLCSKKSKNNDKYSPQLNRLHNSLQMSIVKTPKRDLSNIKGKYDMRKARTSLAK